MGARHGLPLLLLKEKLGLLRNDTDYRGPGPTTNNSIFQVLWSMKAISQNAVQ